MLVATDYHRGFSLATEGRPRSREYRCRLNQERKRVGAFRRVVKIRDEELGVVLDVMCRVANTLRKLECMGRARVGRHGSYAQRGGKKPKKDNTCSVVPGIARWYTASITVG